MLERRRSLGQQRRIWQFVIVKILQRCKRSVIIFIDRYFLDRNLLDGFDYLFRRTCLLLFFLKNLFELSRFLDLDRLVRILRRFDRR